MLKIRKANINDIDAIADIEKRCFPAAEAASKSTFESRMNIFINHFYVAEIDGEIVGFVNGFVSDERTIRDEMFEDASLHNESGKYQMIFGLDVLKEHRRKGIGHKLVQTMIEAAKDEGRAGVILTCKNELISYYEGMGFINRGASKSVHGGAVWYDMELIF
ncbi:GNAT family N-acetyltransferase [Ruminiclostridium herbifermentans]|uniref:GNAT family N-acetyltransferase n=1 Tax=Ruminiclostridium herbifermentans TaxID=2488810 RepID=A0A4U7JKK8_9FIRM|nr:GNAT family N-acetyltransferase [Ruminiclostridium herbifermentans]QNU68596.1 GNAT family N-acetyltransferase [Ruminiclostridium herbifermentans]